MVLLIKKYRRLGLIPVFISVQWDIQNMTIFVYTDAGRLCRPIFYVDEETGKPSYMKRSRTGARRVRLRGWAGTRLAAPWASEARFARLAVRQRSSTHAL